MQDTAFFARGDAGRSAQSKLSSSPGPEPTSSCFPRRWRSSRFSFFEPANSPQRIFQTVTSNFSVESGFLQKNRGAPSFVAFTAISIFLLDRKMSTIGVFTPGLPSDPRAISRPTPAGRASPHRKESRPERISVRRRFDGARAAVLSQTVASCPRQPERAGKSDASVFRIVIDD